MQERSERNSEVRDRSSHDRPGDPSGGLAVEKVELVQGVVSDKFLHGAIS